MLESNKISIYTEQLQPRMGYEVDQALCLTFSLDLTMLMAAGVALFLGKEIEGNTDKERYDVLAALQAGKDKLRVFCHAGHIAVPQTYNRLYSLVEPCVRMIALKNNSFHPKLWLIRYKKSAGKGSQLYFKLIVMSRNLTDSRDWDVSFSAEGEPADARRANRSLIEYLNSLPHGKPDKEYITAITDQLNTVVFDLPENCLEWNFIGFPGSPLPMPTKMKRLAIISPFLTESRLSELVSRTAKSKVFLFSRQESLDEISSALIEKSQCFTLKSSIIEGEKLIQEEFGLPKHNELHAKCYFWEDSTGTHGFMGSANCSEAAFAGNYEAMILMKFKKGIIDSVLASLIDSEGEKADPPKLFIPYIRTDKAAKDHVAETLDQIRNNLALGKPYAEIRKLGSTYETLVNFECPVHIPGGYSATLYPYGCGQMRYPYSKEQIAFGPQALHELTAFFVFEITKQDTNSQISFIMRLDLNCPPEILSAREAALYRTIFPNVKKLLTYLAWLIEEETLNDPEIFVPRQSSETGQDSDVAIYESIPFFERLLIIAAENPYRLRRVSDVISILEKKNDIPSAEFDLLLRFWEPFKDLGANL